MPPADDQTGAETGCVTPAPEPARSRAARAWQAMTEWRRSRPFWAGVLLIVAGLELLLIPLPVNSMGLILHIGTGGVLGIAIGVLLMAMAVLLWLSPQQRTFYSLVAILLSVAALIGSNLGGFLLGTLLGVLGGSLGFAWMPEDRPDGTLAAGESAVGAPLAPDPARGSGLYRVLLPLPLAVGLVLAVLPGASPASVGPAAAADPSCSTSPGPSPDPSDTASATPDPSCSPDPDPSASADPSPDPSSSPSASASSSPSGSPSPSDSASASPSPSPSTPPPTATVPASLIASSQMSGITADSATLDGATFDGVATVQTAGGPEQVLKFSLTELTLSNADLTVTAASGQTLNVQATTFDFSGNVTLLTTKISGSLLGATVTFTPQSPPPTLPANLTLTSVSSSQIFTSADSFSISGLQINSAG